jgi:hypothetical protein
MRCESAACLLVAYHLTVYTLHGGIHTEGLKEVQGLELDVPVLVRLAHTGVHDTLEVVLINRGKGLESGCNPNDLGIWVSVEGPENMAVIATPDPDGM